MTKFKAFLLMCVLLLSACQTTLQTTGKSPPVVSGASEWLQSDAYFELKRAQFDLLNGWQYTAKIGISTPTVSEVANIVWNFKARLEVSSGVDLEVGSEVDSKAQSNDVRLFGPLGIGAVSLQFNAESVMLLDNAGVKHFGNNAQELLTEIVGWPIPIDSLRMWLFALPNPDAVFRYKLDSSGNDVIALEQAGWQINYSAYRLYGEAGTSTRLPRKITATKILPDGTKLVVKLITKSWSF